MSDEIEQKIEPPKIQRPPEAVTQAGQFTNTNKQSTWTDATEGNRTTQKDSATMESLSDEKIAEIKSKGGFQKFELFDSTAPQPLDDQILLASNLTPSLEQLQQAQGIQSDTQSDQRVAWNPKKDIQTQLDKAVYPHRDNKEAFVDKEAARQVSQHFSRLAGYSERHDGIAPKLIAAILKNEQTYYRTDKDALPDAIVRRTGNLPRDLTIGPAQMSLSNVRQLAKEYPDVLGSVADSTHLATDKTYATMLVGAYLDQKIQTFESWTKHPPDRTKLTKDERYQYDHALPLWKAGMETKALIMSYNPAAGLDHMNNVLKYLRD